MRRRSMLAVVLAVWLALMCIWVRRGLLASPAVRPAVESSVAAAAPAETEGAWPAWTDEWMGAYHGADKIGYVHRRFVRQEEGYALEEESVLKLQALGTPQVVRARTEARAGRDFSLRSFRFELRGGGGLRVDSVVEDGSLRFVVAAGEDETTHRVPLDGPIFLPQLVLASIGRRPPSPGESLATSVFNPATLRSEPMTVTVEAEEDVPHLVPPVRAWRVRQESGQVVSTAWLANGRLLREEGALGLALVSESADRALNGGWPAGGSGVDLVRKMAIPVDRALPDARSCRGVRMRVSGIPLTAIPANTAQRLDRDILTVSSPDPDSLQSYTLPYKGAHAGELAATASLQSDHPRIRALVREILGGESDARSAAVRLTDWVFRYLRKVPAVTLPNALQVLDAGEGDCNEHAALLAALCRAAGLPARVVAGVVYLDQAFYYHAWCDVWLGRWVAADAVFNQLPADAAHVELVPGDVEGQLQLLGIIGRLELKVVADECGPVTSPKKEAGRIHPD